MNTDHVKGSIKETKGKVKEEIGHTFGKEKMATEGVKDQVVGKVQKAFGDIKDKVKEKVDKVLHSDDRKVS